MQFWQSFVPGQYLPSPSCYKKSTLVGSIQHSPYIHFELKPHPTAYTNTHTERCCCCCDDDDDVVLDPLEEVSFWTVRMLCTAGSEGHLGGCLQTQARTQTARRHSGPASTTLLQSRQFFWLSLEHTNSFPDLCDANSQSSSCSYHGDTLLFPLAILGKLDSC